MWKQKREQTIKAKQKNNEDENEKNGINKGIEEGKTTKT